MSVPLPSSITPAMSNAVSGAMSGLAADSKALDRLRLAAGRDAQGSVREVARQLESLFMRELIKSMREATMKSGLTDSAQGDLASDLFDQQMALQMSGMGGGLSRAIERQLSAAMGADGGAPKAAGKGNAAGPAAPVRMPNAADTLRVRPLPRSPGSDAAGAALSAPAATPPAFTPATISEAQQRFVGGLHRTAMRVARDSGIPASYMLGQAALETGWGQRQIRMGDGSPSFNLFGIKADAAWRGKVAEVVTTEYIDGQPRRVSARFRAYDSYEQSFEDYARLIGSSPRYAEVRQQMQSAQAFAAGLQRAGYATDPQYAAKLGRTIEAALRVQRLMV